jgi:hypothetical protein
MYCLKDTAEKSKQLKITGMFESDQYGRFEILLTGVRPIAKPMRRLIRNSRMASLQSIM